MYLGLLLTVINSGVKLLTASLVLDVITGWGIPGCAAFVVCVSVVWGALAGIKTVIWTDFLLFILFTAGALFALGFVASDHRVCEYGLCGACAGVCRPRRSHSGGCVGSDSDGS